MSDLNQILLFSRDEADDLSKRKLTDEEWSKIREWITTDDNMWQVIDECIKITIDEVLNG